MTDFEYHGVDAEYDYTDCKGCNGYCRCKKIINTKITSINYTKIVNFFNQKTTPKGNKEIFNYCADRIVRHNINKDNFFVSISPGYYGEEVNGIFLEGYMEDDIKNKILSLTDMKNNEMMELALIEEYGHLLEKLNNCEWKLETINASNIRIGNDNHYRRLDKNQIEKYKKWDGVICLVDDKHKIIDGYHRLKATTKRKIRVIKAIQNK